MKCAYCGREATLTREHIISSGILDLFPECYLTIDGKRNVMHQADPVVKDVCSNCNNNCISYIDNYAKAFIERYFIQKYSENDTLNIEYDYTMIQKMLLKYAFNDLRSQKEDISFFSKKVIDFLLDKDNNTPLNNVFVLGGLAVNTSPVPDYMFGNLKLQWGMSPMLLQNSIVQNLNYETGQVTLRENQKTENFEGLILSYIFRFNSGQFILLCWDETCSIIDENMKVIGFQYPYEVLNNKDVYTTIRRCTSELTYHNIMMVDVSWGNMIMDDITTMRRLAFKSSESIMNSINKQWEQEEQYLAQKYKR